jgi:hypothetical protein
VVVRYFVDPATGQPHIYQHQVSETEVGDVLARAMEDRPGRDDSRIAIGQTAAPVSARHLRARPAAGFGLCYHGVRAWAEGAQGASSAPTEEIMKQANFPPGWDEARVRRVLEHYERQSDDEAVAEDEAAYESTTHTAMEVPVDLVPAVRELLAKRRVG